MCTAFGGTIGGKPMPLESNAAVPVNIQDQVTPPVDSFFLQQLATFQLAADTVASTTTVLSYTFTAVAGHGLVATDEILLLDVAVDRSFYAVVTNVAVNTITVDRPIDHVFPAPGLNQKVTSEMAVNGSVTPQRFAIQVGTMPIDLTRVIISIVDDVSMDTSKFGDLPALSNGFVFRIVNSYQKTIFNFKTNGDIAQFCYDVNYADKAPAGEFGLTARITFAGQDKHGVVIRLSGQDQAQWIVQDDLTGLLSLKVALQGHEIFD